MSNPYTLTEVDHAGRRRYRHFRSTPRAILALLRAYVSLRGISGASLVGPDIHLSVGDTRTQAARKAKP